MIEPFKCGLCGNETMVLIAIHGMESNALVCRACKDTLHYDSSHRAIGLPCHPSETAVVFRDREGNIKTPGRNDVPTPEGFERVEMRSIYDLRRLDRETGKRSEVLDYDRHSGRSFPSGHPDNPIF